MALDARKKKILKAIVDDYVSTAEPVGSQSLVRNHCLGVSSATVRNEMSELEELGYLEKPHTSAGRVPSDKGYRAYVDQLLQISEVSRDDQASIETYFRDNLHEVTELIRKSAGILAQQTDYPSLVLSPHYSDTSLQQIKILMIEPGKALVVVVLSAGIVKDRLIRVSADLDATDLAVVARAIEEGLSGKKLDDITLITVSSAAADSGLPEPVLNQILFEAYVSIKQAENTQLYVEGAHQLLNQPEFQDVKKAHRFLDMLQQDGLVAGYMRELKNEGETLTEERDEADAPQSGQASRSALIPALPEPMYMVRIGQEIALDGLSECSFITTTYRVTDRITGRIGVVGPKRMAYGHIIAQINFVNQKLNEHISRLALGDDKREERDEQKKA